jgi:hypothetical protein
MKPKDLFNLAIRVLGLVFLYHGLSALPALIPLILSAVVLPFAVAALMAAWQFLLAYWLLRGAPLLMRIAYPETPGRSESEQPVFAATERKADA